MKTFQFRLHTTEISLRLDDESDPAIGFYTIRRAKGTTYQEAFKKIMDEFDSDEKITGIIQTGHDAGLRPTTEVEDYWIVPWYRAILPWEKPGLVFYGRDEEEESAGSWSA